MKNLRTFVSGTEKTIDTNFYGGDNVSYTLVADTNYIEIGLYKPFYGLFFSIVSQSLAGTIKVEYYDGSGWELLSATDETKDFSRSGFLRWETEISEIELNSESLYWIRITGDIDGVLDGINMVFANDDDLRTYYRKIDDYLNGDTSFISLHQASRNDIVQRIRNSGKYKVNGTELVNLNIWDFLKPQELRSAGTYLCLSKIFENISDSVEGKFESLSKKYFKAYLDAENTFLTTLDGNDDGKKDIIETNASAIRTTRIIDV